MANGDVYKINLVSELNGVAMSNGFSLRADADSAPGLEFPTLLNLVEQQIVPLLPQALSEELTFTCISARRSVGASSSSFSRFINVPGTILGDSLPSTCYLKLQYYSYPVEPRTAFALRFSGIPEPDSANGRVRTGNLLLFEPFINFMVADNITFAGNSYRWVTNNQYPLLAPITNHPIVKANIQPCLYNLRGRQTSLCV